jgi:hypothetical protein
MSDFFERSKSSNERILVRRIMILTIITIVTMTGFEVRAAQRRVRTVSSGQGPVRSLIDLERRKNAALRQMFFGR